MNKFVFALMLLTVFYISCETSTKSQNNQPAISSLTADPDSVEVDSTSNLVCIATDPDGDNLIYTWETTAGTINGSGSNVTWVAPDSAGTFVVSCKVDDDNGGQANENVDIVVTETNFLWEQTSGPVDNYIWSLAINSLNHIFAGTEDSGLYRSTDNGETWIKMDIQGGNPALPTVWSIACNLSDHIFVGKGGRIFRSIDNGSTWTETGFDGGDAKSIVINNFDYIYTAGGGGVHRSKDNGDTWTEINDGLLYSDVTTLGISSTNTIFVGTLNGEVFRLDEITDTWIKTGLTITDQPLDYYDIVMTIALNSSDYIFTGTNGAGIYRSIDNGDSWVEINNGLTNTDVRIVVFNSSDWIFIGTDGGVFFSKDNCDSWKKAGDLSGYVLSLSIDSNDNLFAGTSHGVFRCSIGY